MKVVKQKIFLRHLKMNELKIISPVVLDRIR